MKTKTLYIVSGNERIPKEISEFSKIIFLDKEQEKFKNKFSLIKNIDNNQVILRRKWLNLQQLVIKKIKSKLLKDNDLLYVFSNMFFESSPMKTDSIYKFLKLQLIIKYIKTNRINKIILHKVSPDIESFFYKNSDLLNVSIEKLDKSQKNKFSIKTFKNMLKKNISVTLFYYLFEEIKKKIQGHYPQTSSLKKVVFSYYYPGGQSFDDKFYSKFFGSVSLLLNNKFGWLFLYTGDYSKIGSQKKFVKNNVNSFGFLDAYIKISEFKEIITRFLIIRKKLRLIEISNLFISNKLNYLSLIRNDWLNSSTFFLMGLLIFEKKIFNFFKKNPQINEALYMMEFQPWENIFNRVAKKFNVKTKGVIHSITRPNVMNYYHSRIAHNYYDLPSYVGVNSDFSRSLMIKNGFKKNQVFKIEAQRFNYLLNKKNKITFSKHKLKKSILIITSIIYQETFEMLNYFASVDLKFENVYIKEHYLFPVSSMIKSKIKNFPKFTVLNCSMSDAFNLTDIVLTTNGSSVLLESVMSKKQTISLLSLTSLPIPVLTKGKNLHFIYDTPSLSKILKKLIYLPLKNFDNKTKNNYLYLDNKLKFWKKFINL